MRRTVRCSANSAPSPSENKTKRPGSGPRFLDVAEERDGYVQIALSESAHPRRSVGNSLKPTCTHHRQRLVKAFRVSIAYSASL